MPNRTIYLSIVVAVFIAEVLIATTFAHIPFLRSYISDYLVVILLYHFLKLFYDFRPPVLATFVFVVACVVEVSQYFHLADALGVPRGSLLAILLGNSFSWLDIAMYLLGCLTSWGIDATFLRRTNIAKRNPKPIID